MRRARTYRWTRMRPYRAGSEGRAYSSPSNPGRAASPIYSDLICDRHSRRLLGFVSVRLVKGTVVFDPQYPNLKTEFFLDFSCAALVMVGWAAHIEIIARQL